jgi:hypothetical protein
MSANFKWGCALLAGVAFASLLRADTKNFVTPECLAVVVHPTSSVENLSASMLRKMLTGGILTWPNSSPVVVIEQPEESPTQKRALKILLGTTSAGYKRLLLVLQFQGKDLPAIKILNSDVTAIKFVWNVPGAVAIVDASAIASFSSHVKVLKIDGLLPGEAGYLLK